MIAQAKRDALTLVTTEKDMVRLRNTEAAQDIVPFPVTLEFEDPAQLRKFIASRLFQARENNFRTSN